MKLPKLNARYRMFDSLLKYILLAPLLLIICSCATLYGQNNREITINSVPQGAKVYLNGVEYAKTPASIVLPSVGFRSVKLILKKPGYKDATVLVETEFQNVGYWNLIVFPSFLFDLGTGYMFKIKPGYYLFNIHLESETEKIGTESYVSVNYFESKPLK